MGTLDRIDHFVVLMLENRSFDNVLGFSRPQSPDFNGLTGNEKVPSGGGTNIKVWSRAGQSGDMRLPTPDPGELFTDINEQLFGSQDTTATPEMNGFAINYRKNGGKVRRIMHGFLPKQLPALTMLARSFGVSDAWFASAPCQTWPNRFFVHTGTANGFENNSPVHLPYTMPTIFNVLNDKVPNDWHIYFHDFPQSLTLARLWDHLEHFRPFSTFVEDARKGALPSYAFIEPRYFADVDWPNDMHPPHSVSYGDQLVATVYNALRSSPRWESTLLIITYDEHGGCYDHVPPPAAVSPEARREGQVFAFDRYGVRVPAIFVSPHVKAGTVVRSNGDYPFDHTSIIRTLRKRFGIGDALTGRDAAAPDLEAALTLDGPANPEPRTVQGAKAPPDDDERALDKARLAPLNHFQKAVHDAVRNLQPLADGVAAEDHIKALIEGFTPTLAKATVVKDAVRDVKNFIGKILL